MHLINKLIVTSLMVVVIAISMPISAAALASDNAQEARVVSKEQIDCLQLEPDTQCYRIGLQLNETDSSPEVFYLEIEVSAYSNNDYKVGDDVFVDEYLLAGESVMTVSGYNRQSSILLLVGLFVVASVVVGGKQGLGSLLGLIISIVVLFGVTVPMILDGGDPVLAGLIGAVMVLTASIFLSHGFNSKSLTALIATFVGLGAVSILAVIFIRLVNLSGFGEEEGMFLADQLDSYINMRGILFASIIVAGIGIMDDVTVNQVSALQEIYKANPRVDRFYLFRSSMNIGRDHIASMVNTLFIAYAGASMPLIMLLSANNVSFQDIVNTEMFAEEIVRTFIGSIGLILVVPITSFVASYLITWRERPKWLFQVRG